MTLVISGDSVTFFVGTCLNSSQSHPHLEHLAGSRLVSKASQVVVGVMALGYKTIQIQGGSGIQFYLQD